MKITKVVETQEGKVEFNGELSQEEMDLVVEAGLAILLRMGVLSIMNKPEEESNIVLN